MTYLAGSRAEAIRAVLKTNRIRALELKPLITYYGRILDIRDSQTARLDAGAQTDEGTPETARQTLLEGSSFWSDPREMVTDPDFSLEVFEKLLDEMPAEENEELGEKLDKIRTALSGDRAAFGEFLGAVGSMDYESVSSFTSIRLLDRDVLVFLAHHALRSPREAKMKKMKDLFSSDSWLRGTCPYCGSYPYLSIMSQEEGFRYLHCNMCGGIWEGKRVFCPFCANDDHETLHYLYIEEESEYRIDVCEKCTNYIKSVDARKLERPVDPEIEDLATLYLDLVAHQEKYDRLALLPIPAVFDSEEDTR